MDFNTKYGQIKLTTATSSDLPEGFPDLDIRDKLNSVEIDDNPYNTYGLASKWMVLSSIDVHNNSKDAHSDLFNSFISQLYDMYDKQGELKINAITDEYDNKIFANRKLILNGDVEHPKFLVYSNERRADYDALKNAYDDLLRRVEALEELLPQQ